MELELNPKSRQLVKEVDVGRGMLLRRYVTRSVYSVIHGWILRRNFMGSHLGSQETFHTRMCQAEGRIADPL